MESRLGRLQKPGDVLVGEGCDFVIWNTIAGHILTDEEKKSLINGDKTELISDFFSKKGNMFPGKLVLDEDKKVVFVKKEDM